MLFDREIAQMVSGCFRYNSCFGTLLADKATRGYHCVAAIEKSSV